MRYLYVGHVMRALLSREQIIFLNSLDDAFGHLDHKLDQILQHIHKEERFMEASQDVLLNAFGELNSAVNDLVNAEASGAAEIAALAETIKNLPPGTALTADQIADLANQATTAAQAMNDAVAAAQTPPEPTPEPPQ